MDPKSASYDIAVFGAGISGLAVAARALECGLSVVLLERKGLAEATSSASLRIMHGGIRYLQNLDLPRLWQSAAAQHEVLKLYPDLMRPLRCLMPLRPSGLRSRRPMALGGALYRALTWKVPRWAGAPRVLSAPQISSEYPELDALCGAGAFEWYDVTLLDPAALHARIARTIEAEGGAIFCNSVVRACARMANGFTVEAGSLQLHSRVVVDARGPWISETFQATQRQPHRSWCKAFNVILSRQIFPDVAFGIQTAEKRLFFLVPRDTSSVLGTAYLPFDGDPSSVAVSAEEIELFLKSWSEAAPNLAVGLSDVEAVECGVLPLEPDGGSELALVGQEKLTDENGYIRVLSTKYTTFRPQAHKVLELAKPYLMS